MYQGIFVYMCIAKSVSMIFIGIRQVAVLFIVAQLVVDLQMQHTLTKLVSREVMLLHVCQDADCS